MTRIGYAGEPDPTLNTLCGLQEAHLLTVPFENLDISAGRKISLEPNSLFQKIVLENRGGFCYELNGLFHVLLKEIGYDVMLLMGRVYDRNHEAYGRDFDHMLILAEVEREGWIVDVGFGDFSLHPLRFTLDQPLTDRNGEFLIERHDREYFRISRLTPSTNRFSPEYLFSLRECSLSDFAEMCLYHQTSPESHFTTQRICSLATPAGRMTLTDSKLILTVNGTREEIMIRGESEFAEALRRHFKIVLGNKDLPRSS